MPSEDTKMLELNKNQIFDRALFLIDLQCLLKRLVDVQIILKIHPQQNQVNIFHQVFQCLQNHNLKAQQKSMRYSEVKIV